MVKELNGLGAPAAPVGPGVGQGIGKTSESGGKSFGEFLTESLRQVDDLQKGADAAVEQIAKGGGPGIQEAMIAIEKADVAFKLMMEVRQKILDAYQEVVRMQM